VAATGQNGLETTDDPLFSVVIPAYNAAATVRSAVASALAQTRPELEVVIVDDGSTDDTGEVVARIDDPRVRLHSQPNRGLSAARNAGIRVARGKYIAFLDSDDLWLPSFLELTGRALDAASDPGFAYTDAYAFDSLSGKVRRRTAMERNGPPIPPPDRAADFLLELLKRNFVYVSTAVPRSVLDSVGCFDETLTAVEDYELWLRIVIAGHQPIWIPGQHALYRTHAGQMSSDQVKMSSNLSTVYAGLRMEDMPGDAHRELLESRRIEAERELRTVGQEASLRAAIRGVRHRLGRIRKRLGLGDTWYDTAPADVAAAFPDLTAV
jgi:GT2 family glycosyltransferase